MVQRLPEQQDADFMGQALALAAQAAAEGEVPVGAVIVKDGVVIGTGRNHPVQSSDPTAHAEIAALRAAAQHLGNYRLDGCTLYVTLEPCAMCSGAMLHARIQRLVYGAADGKTGCCGSVVDLFAQTQLNHHTEVQSGVMAAQSAALLQDFFQGRRATQKLQAFPLRDDALRTPEARFSSLPQYPWPPHYASDLPCLQGLRMHFIDEGPEDAADVTLLLHPVPGWSYALHAEIAARVGRGERVIAPDLIGFGKSDKPKRVDFHSLYVHAQSLVELLDSLQLTSVNVYVAESTRMVAQQLAQRSPGPVKVVKLLDVQMPGKQADEFGAWESPYPDAGHRAGERAWLRLTSG